ncbi:hypothetical protein BJ970_002998 [Saccharopolyspora phatthalungensis]|uniref:PPE family domain-containing protein n=1 Tax=Saccharopolyspora phatthalungensis TaxID=664693 RepID=A0A840Q4J5_9PSEU|nr:hypothetical protein [Saccharopolyspora phatthalungensis]
MGAFDWLFGKREIPGQAQAEFDHPKIYGEVESGPGVAAASQAAASWRDRVSTAFAEADSDLDRVLKKFDAVMHGSAGEQAKESVTPLSLATRASIEIAAQVSGVVEQQAQGSADFKNGFPAPYQVPPDNIGWGDYVNPVSYSVKSGVRAAHEEHHDQVDAQARQQYESYTHSTNDRVNGVQQFAPPPSFTGDVTPASTTPVQKVDPSTGYTGTTDTGSGQASTYRTSSTDTPSPSSGQQSAVSPTPQAPAESGSAWATPPASGTTPPVPGGGAPTPGPGGGGFVGGAVIPPGSTGGPGAGTSGRIGGGGTGTGRGAGSLGRGPGAGGGVGRVPGGSSGVGGSTPGGSSGAGARGGTSGVAAGAGAAGRGKRGRVRPVSPFGQACGQRAFQAMPGLGTIRIWPVRTCSAHHEHTGRSSLSDTSAGGERTPHTAVSLPSLRGGVSVGRTWLW